MPIFIFEAYVTASSPPAVAKSINAPHTVSEIGDTENISKSSVSRILRLALLAPDITETILVESADQSLMLERLERPLPAGWEEQRAAFRCAG